MDTISRKESIAFAAVTAAASCAVYWLIAIAWGVEEAGLTAIAVLFFLFFHEFCHAIVLESSGIKTVMIFSVVGAGVAPVPQNNARYDEMHYSRKAALMIAGVFGNLLIALVAIGLKQAGLLSSAWADWTINLNAILVIFNLLPFGNLDGGRFARVLFDSISEDRDFRFARAMAAMVMLAAAASLVINSGFSMFVPLVVVGLYSRARDDDPIGSAKRNAMTRRQQRWWAVAYVAIFCVALLMYK